MHLNFLGFSRCPVPLRLIDPEEGEEEPEGIDNEQFLLQLSGIHMSPIGHTMLTKPKMCRNFFI